MSILEKEKNQPNPSFLDTSFSNDEGLELSTKILIKNAKKRGIHVEILDHSANFLRLTKDQKIEYVKQATKTSLENYISFSCMEDKNLSKILLRQENIIVPDGYCYSPKELNDALQKQKDLTWDKWVVKPSTSNYGIGITILEKNSSKIEYKKALEQAFANGERAIVEEFIPGNEYRFLVLGGECTAVCQRIPANVIGNGYCSVIQLIEKKNQDPKRGKGHVTPFEKIEFGKAEIEYLRKQGITTDYIVPEDQRIFLCANSNVSTGGDAIDCTDDIADFYKKIAIRAATKAVQSVFCGVDIIIPDDNTQKTNQKSILEEKKIPNYIVLEVNFNPALYMHEFPYEGQARPVTERVLDLLGF